MKFNRCARLTAEFLGSAFLVAAVVGSGIMGERLASGNVAIALLANTIATGAALLALILTFGPISGAHLNPAVPSPTQLSTVFLTEVCSPNPWSVSRIGARRSLLTEVASAASERLVVPSYFSCATVSTITRSSSPLVTVGTLSTTPLLL